MEDANFQNKTVDQIYDLKKKYTTELEAGVYAWFTSDRHFISCQAAIEDLDNASGTVKSWKSSSALSYFSRHVYAVWNSFFDCPGVKSKEKKAEKAAEKARKKDGDNKGKTEDEEENAEADEDEDWDWPDWEEDQTEA